MGMTQNKGSVPQAASRSWTHSVLAAEVPRVGMWQRKVGVEWGLLGVQKAEQSPGWPLPTSSSDSNPCPQHFYGCQEILRYHRAVRGKVRETLCWGLRLRPHSFLAQHYCTQHSAQGSARGCINIRTDE